MVPSSSGPKLIINGTEVSSVPWDGGDRTTVSWDSGLNESATPEQAEAAFRNGPWYFWEQGEQNLTIDRSQFPGVWNSQEHGLYFTKQSESIDSNGNFTLHLTRSNKIKSQTPDGENPLTYSRGGMSMLDLPDGASSVLMVSVPGIEGTYLVYWDLFHLYPKK